MSRKRKKHSSSQTTESTGSVPDESGSERGGPIKSTKSFIADNRYFWIRFVVLLVVLVPLAFYAYRQYRWTVDQSAVAQLLAKRHDNEAIAKLNELEDSYGKRGEFAFLKARGYRHLSEMELAEQHLEMAEQLDFPKTSVIQERRLISALSGDTDNLAQNLDDAIGNENVALDDIFDALTIGYLVRMRFKDAEKVISMWMQQSADAPGPHYAMALMAQYQYQWDPAEKMLEKALTIQPDYPPALFAMAENLFHLNRQAEAVEYYERFLEFRPKALEARLGLANALVGSNQLERAAELMREIASEPTASFDSKVLLGKTELDLGNAQEAVNVLTPIASDWPKDVELNYTLGRAFSQIGDDEAADRHFAVSEEGRKILEDIDIRIRESDTRPDDWQLKTKIGHELLHYRSREQGRFFLITALLVNQKNIEAHRDLQLFYERTGDKESATYHADMIRQIQLTPEPAGS